MNELQQILHNGPSNEKHVSPEWELYRSLFFNVSQWNQTSPCDPGTFLMDDICPICFMVADAGCVRSIALRWTLF